MSIPVGHWVNDDVTAKKWLDYFVDAAKHTSLGYDTETSGLNIVSDCVIVWSLSDGVARVCLPARYLEMFRIPILENPSVRLVGTNLKFDAHMTANSGVNISKVRTWLDTIPQSWLLNENNLGRHGLKECVKDHFGRVTPSFEQTFGKVPPKKIDKITGKNLNKTVGDLIKDAFRGGTPEMTPEEFEMAELKQMQAADYASLDAYNSKVLNDHLDTLLAKVPTGYGTLKDLYHNVESPFTRVLWKMERRGITADGGYLKGLQGPMEAEMLAIESEFNNEATKLSGSPTMLNLDSVNDVRSFFYTLMQKPQTHMTDGGQTGNKQPSTDHTVLEEWAGEGDPWARKLLRYRNITKTYGTYVIGLQKWIDHHSRIHTTFKQIGAVTGRLSSAEPNLQNVPAPDSDEYKIRDGFIAGNQKRLYVADYEQLEMRLTAIFTGDKKMIDAINSGLDVHCFTVSEMQKIPYEKVKAAKDAKDAKKKLTPEEKHLVLMRGSAKAAGFGILYGIGGAKLAADQTRDTGVFMSEEEGKGTIRAWLNVFDMIDVFIQQTKKHIWNFGYVQTILGRFRRFGDLKGMSKRDRAEAERQSFNSVIQGSAADLAKVAMIVIDDDDVLRNLGYEMMLQVHDEIVGEGPDDDEIAEKIKARKKHLMETALGTDFAVKLSCSIGDGYTWASAKA